MPTEDDLIRRVEDMLTVGEIPDVIFLGGKGRNSVYRFMVENNLALDLMPYIQEDDGFRNSLAPANLDYWTTGEGKLYTVSDVLLLSGGYWYNADIFRKAESKKYRRHGKNSERSAKKSMIGRKKKKRNRAVADTGGRISLFCGPYDGGREESAGKP